MSKFYNSTQRSPSPRRHASLDTASGDDTFFDTSSRLWVDLDDDQNSKRRRTRADSSSGSSTSGSSSSPDDSSDIDNDQASTKHKSRKTGTTSKESTRQPTHRKSMKSKSKKKTSKKRSPQLGPDEIRLDDLLACANNALRSFMREQKVVHDLLSEPIHGPLSYLGPVGCVVRLLYRAVRRDETLASWRHRHQDIAPLADASASNAVPGLPDTAPRLDTSQAARKASLLRSSMPGARESPVEPDSSLFTDAIAGPWDAPELDDGDSVWDAIAKSERIDADARQGRSMALPVWQAITKNYSTSRSAGTPEDPLRSPPPPGVRAWKSRSNFDARRTSILASIASITETDAESAPAPPIPTASEIAPVAPSARQPSRTLSSVDRHKLDQLNEALSNSDRLNVSLANLIFVARDALTEAEEDIRLLEDLNAKTLEESQRVQAGLAVEISTVNAALESTQRELYAATLFRSYLEDAIDQSEDRDIIVHTASYNFLESNPDNAGRAAANDRDAEFQDYLDGKPVPSENKSYYAELHARIKRIAAAQAENSAQVSVQSVQNVQGDARGETMADWIAPMPPLGGLGSANSWRSLRSLHGPDPDPGTGSASNSTPPSPANHLLSRKNSGSSGAKRRGSGRYLKRPRNLAASPALRDFHIPQVLGLVSESAEPASAAPQTPSNLVPATSPRPADLPGAGSISIPPAPVPAPVSADVLPSAVNAAEPVETADGVPDLDPAKPEDLSYNELRKQLRTRRQARGTKAFVGVELPRIYLPENPSNEPEIVPSGIDGTAPPTEKLAAVVNEATDAFQKANEINECARVSEARDKTHTQVHRSVSETALTIVVQSVEIVPESVPETALADTQERGTQTVPDTVPATVLETTAVAPASTDDIPAAPSVADVAPHDRVQAVERFCNVPKRPNPCDTRPELVRNIIACTVRFIREWLWQQGTNVYLIGHWCIVVFWAPVLWSLLETALHLPLSLCQLWHRKTAGSGSPIDDRARHRLRVTDDDLPPPYSAHSPSVCTGRSVDDTDGNVVSVASTTPADEARPLAPARLPAAPFPIRALADLAMVVLVCATLVVLRLAIAERSLWINHNATLPREYLYTYIKQYERDTGSCATNPYLFSSFYRSRYAPPPPTHSPYHFCTCVPTFVDLRIVLEPIGRSWLYFQDFWRDYWRLAMR